MAAATRSLPLTVFLLLSSTHFVSFVSPTPTSTPGADAQSLSSRTEGSENGGTSFHLPIYKQEHASARHPTSRLARRGTFTGAIGLGDFYDVTYNVLVKIGGAEMPLVLDTGSSDLWAISDACSGTCAAKGIPVYPQASFQSSGIEAKLFYGDSISGTHAFGLIGKDNAGIGGLTMSNQVFASINATNSSVTATNSAGIFGLGFPINSVIFNNLFKAQFPSNFAVNIDDVDPADVDLNAIPSKRSLQPKSPLHPSKRETASGSKSKDGKNRKARIRPNINHDPRRNDYVHQARRKAFAAFHARQTTAATNMSSSAAANLLSTFSTNGPLIPRMITAGQLKVPSMTISLQRDTVDFGGNVGLLSIGALPDGVSNSSLTWVPIRGYTVAEGGITPPPDSPNEVYPISWEVRIDNVYLDGQLLPNSTLAPGIVTTALIDTGNSLIRGPSDVVAEINRRVLGKSSTYDCSIPHTLAFEIGGKKFPVDPRDFPFQAFEHHIDECAPNVVATDPPQTGFLYSWSLGDPFLKSVLASYHFGNLTRPSLDPPRIGFLSTVPADASARLADAIAAAQRNNNDFLSTEELAPTGTFTPAGTGVGGVGLAPTISPVDNPSSAPSSSAPTSPVTLPAEPSSTPPSKPGKSAATRISSSGLLVSLMVGVIGGVFVF